MDAKQSTLQFRITLRHIEPRIWRRIEVPASYSFWDLHVAIQDAMGWLDYHLHVFRVRNPETRQDEEIGIPDDDPFEGDPVYLPGWKVPISEYFYLGGTRAEYEYDFGDGWEHDLELEAVGHREAGTKYPRCLAGERACPPEDCGGPPGYERLLGILSNPADEEYDEMSNWVGGPFDAQAFDPERVRFDNPKVRWRKAFGRRRRP
jgi:Plasmid pRiA4b ORF-3-like protein